MKLCRMCQANSAAMAGFDPCSFVHICAICPMYVHVYRVWSLTTAVDRDHYRHKLLNTMSDEPSPKRQALQASGTFNPRAALVRHTLFAQSDFFDPQDLLQLKYETLRALDADDYSVARAAREFGLSRPTIYQAQSQFEQQGLEGLLPRKRGPHQPHKLTAPVREYLRELRRAEPSLSAEELARRVRQRFERELHPRTIEKALHPKAKRGLWT